MGRPIKKRFFGPTNSPAAGVGTEAGFTANAGSFGITLIAYIVGGTQALSSVISRQVGSNKYMVTNSDGTGKIVLVNDNTPAAGEGYLVGYLSGSPVAIKKLTARRAVGFDDTVYHWEAQNDSTQDIIVLTAI